MSPSATDTTLTTGTINQASKLYPQFLLFGDSLTQQSWSVLIPALSEQYLRRLDVINRGFSGYNSNQGVQALKQFFPATLPSSSNPQVKLMTVFFGANDASIPGYMQAVPVEKYKANLREVINYDGVRLHKTQLILITPPPIDERGLANENRKADRARTYANACKEIGKEFGLPVLDLWTIYMTLAGWTSNSNGVLLGKKEVPRSDILASLLSDGLHLTPQAYSIFARELMTLIRANLPDHAPEKLPFMYPEWLSLVETKT